MYKITKKILKIQRPLLIFFPYDVYVSLEIMRECLPENIYLDIVKSTKFYISNCYFGFTLLNDKFWINAKVKDREMKCEKCFEYIITEPQFIASFTETLKHVKKYTITFTISDNTNQSYDMSVEDLAKIGIY
jgi:hypothetical protein